MNKYSRTLVKFTLPFLLLIILVKPSTAEAWDSFTDMFDGGGSGGSGDSYCTCTNEDYVAGGGTNDGNDGNDGNSGNLSNLDLVEQISLSNVVAGKPLGSDYSSTFSHLGVTYDVYVGNYGLGMEYSAVARDDEDSDGGGGGGGLSGPGLSLAAEPKYIYPGQTTKLTWKRKLTSGSCTPDNRTGFGGWGSTNLGSAVGSKLFKADTVGNYTFRYSCWFGSSSGYNQTYYASTEVKVVPSPAECVLKASDTTIFVGDTTTFTWVLKNSVGRADLTNPANSIAWGILPSHQNQSRVFKATKPGTFTFKMEVKNSAGKVNKCTKNITVAIKPEVIRLTGKDCVIAAGKNHCLSEMSWAIKHATKPNIYNATTKMSPLSLLAVGTKEQKKINYGDNKIQARDDKQVLDEIIVKATCAEGSDWNGELCGKTKVSLTAENCEIGINKSSCMAKLSWEFENADDPKIINIKTGDEISNALKRENINFKANYKNTRVVAMDGDTTLRQVIVVADCVAGSDWDGSKCSTGNQPSAMIEVEDCEISHGRSTCESNMEWEIRNYNNPSIYNKQMAIYYKGSTVSGGVVSYNDTQEIRRGNNEIQVRVGQNIITSDTARAVCSSNAPWDAVRGICRNSSLPINPITIEFSADSNLIRKGDKARLRWEISDLTGHVCRLSGVGMSGTPINSTNGTIETESLSNKSLFKINCSSGTFGDTAREVTVEVVPVVQEV